VRLLLRNGVEVSAKRSTGCGQYRHPGPKDSLASATRPELSRRCDSEGESRSRGISSLHSKSFIPLAASRTSSWYANSSRSAWKYVQRNSLHGSRRNISDHYDLNTDFTALARPATHLYLRFIIRRPVRRLEQAQAAKNWIHVGRQVCNCSRGACRRRRPLVGRHWPCTWLKTMGDRQAFNVFKRANLVLPASEQKSWN